MRRAVPSTVLLLALGCNEGVSDGANFGSGGSGGPTAGADAGASEGSATQDSGAEGGTGGSASDGEDSTVGSTSSASDNTSSNGAEASDGGETGEATGAEATGSSGESGDTTGGDSGDLPVQDDACGFPLDGPWIEIEYNQAGGTATSPSWSYSDTPGWGESQWAASNASWPEVWDLYQNINVSNDPIGVVAIVGGSSQLQLMLGFEELIDYDYATVCVQGRSVSTSASVQFDAYNPLTGIGNSATMAHDWSMHATGLDLGYAFTPGGGVQAVRLDTTGGSGSLGVKRMRLVLHGAVY